MLRSFNIENINLAFVCVFFLNNYIYLFIVLLGNQMLSKELYYYGQDFHVPFCLKCFHLVPEIKNIISSWTLAFVLIRSCFFLWIKIQNIISINSSTIIQGEQG